MLFWESEALDTNVNTFERGHPVVYRQICSILVPSKHNKCKDQMLLQLVTPGDMFRPLNGHLQANI